MLTFQCLGTEKQYKKTVCKIKKTRHREPP